MKETIRVIGAPMDLGADRRGVDMGPSAMRYAGLADEFEALGISCLDDGNVLVPQTKQRKWITSGTTDDTKHLPEVAAMCERLEVAVAEAVEAGEFPLVLGGDHSIAMGTVGGLNQYDSLGIIWFDAHGDFNTPTTSPSGDIHGMSLAGILGEDEFADAGWAKASNVAAENVALIGARSVDDEEREALRESDITVYTMSDIDERGITDVVVDAIDVVTDGTDGVHVSLDLDWLDPTEAPGVGTPVQGGVSYREAHAAMEFLGRHIRQESDFCGLELVEVNPILDEQNRTAELAVELAASALGKQTL